MSWALGIQAAGALIGAGIDYFGARKERDAAKANTAAMREETTESLRRFEYTIRRNKSTRRARQAASGLVYAGGSQQLAMEAMAGEEWREYEWLQKSGASNADIEAARGRAAALQGYGRAAGTAAGGIGSLGEYGSSVGWWA